MFALGLTWAVGACYFVRFRQDRLVFQVVACVMILLATTDSAVVSYGSYTEIRAGLLTGDVGAILRPNFTLGAAIALAGTSNSILQLFLGYRIVVVSRASGSRVLWRCYAGLIFVLSLASGALGWTSAIIINLKPSSAALQTPVIVTYASYGCSIVSELMSTGALVYLLVVKPGRDQRALGLRRNSLFAALARRAVETNILTATSHIVTIILLTQSSTIGTWFSIPAQILSKLYACVVISSLLTRPSDRVGFSQGPGGAVNNHMSTSYILQSATTGPTVPPRSDAPIK